MPSNPRITKKERALLMGAVRRVFSRSELRAKVIATAAISHTDVSRPRVRKWGRCSQCKEPTAQYQLQCDHISPIVSVDLTLEQMSWDTVVDRTWCVENNLQAICIPCHYEKSRAENKERRRRRKNEQSK